VQDNTIKDGSICVSSLDDLYCDKFDIFVEKTLVRFVVATDCYIPSTVR
jgi:hypothetical protein